MYTIGEAAARSGVPIPLLRAWERRYGVVTPARTHAGYRLYDDAAIDRMRRMRRLVDRGWSPSEAARAIMAGEPAAMRESAESDATPVAVGNRVGALRAEFVHAAVRLDVAALETVLDEMFAGGTYERVVDELLLPALRDLGDAWEAGRADVAAEHAASHAVIRRLAGMYRAAGGRGRTRPVLVGLPAGSRHEIAALAFAVAAMRRGIDVIYIGADVPASSWRVAVHETAAEAVVIGVPTAPDRPAAEEAVAQVATAGVAAFLGGRGVGEVPPRAATVLPDAIIDAVEVLDDSLRSLRPTS